MHQAKISREKAHDFRLSDFEDIARVPRRAAVAAAAALKSKNPAAGSAGGTVPRKTVPATTANSGAFESKPSKRGLTGRGISSLTSFPQTKGKKDGDGKSVGRGGDESGSKRKSSSCNVAALTAAGAGAAVATSSDANGESKGSGGRNQSDLPRGRGNNEGRSFAAGGAKKRKVATGTSVSKSAGPKTPKTKGKEGQDNEPSTSSKIAATTTSVGRRQTLVESGVSSGRKLDDTAIGTGASLLKNPGLDQPNQINPRSNGSSAAGGVIENGQGKDSSGAAKTNSAIHVHGSSSSGKGGNRGVGSCGINGDSADSNMQMDEEGNKKVLEPKTMRSKEDKESAAKSFGDGTPTQPSGHVNKAEASPAPSSSGRRRAVNESCQSLTVHESGASFGASPYPRRIRKTPDVFKPGPSTPTTSVAHTGGGKASDASSMASKPSSAKKGAATVAAAASKSSLAKKPARLSMPTPPPAPPPPPARYKFEFEGWPVIGGRELLSVGLFFHSAAQIMKLGRGFEVRMKSLEKAVSCQRPQDNEFLSMVHSRLLCTPQELKGLKSGENKYPYRLRQRLSDWYRRRGVLRELIFDAERSDDEEEHDTMMQHQQKRGKQQSGNGPLVMATGEGGEEGGLLANGKRKMKLVAPEATVGNGKGKRTASVAPVSEAPVVPQRVSVTHCKVCNSRGTATDMVKCVYEGCGHKYHIQCLSPPLTEVPKGQWYCLDCRAKKHVYGCTVCLQNDHPETILQCDGPKCALEYHLGCLDPPLDAVPKTKWWYCPACMADDNRVGCRVCNKDVDYERLLKCDGPGCDLEWHTYCLKPPLKEVPKGNFFCPYCKAKQRVEFEKRRQLDVARAIEKRRRREAMEENTGDDRANGKRSRTKAAATPRDILRLEYRDLNVHDLRLELHRVDMLLRDIEASRNSAAALGEACQDVAGTHDAADEESTNGQSGASAGAGVAAGDDPGNPAEECTDGSKEGRVRKITQTGSNAVLELGGDALGSISSGGCDGKDAGSDAADCPKDPGNSHAVVAEGGASVDGSAKVHSDGGSVGGEMDTVSAFWAAVAAGISHDDDEQQQQKELEVEDVDGEYGGVGDSPLAKDAAYESLSVPLRVSILSALCEDSAEQEHIRSRVIEETDPDMLRVRPIGYDSAGRLYYRFGQFKKEMRIYRTVDSDAPIPPVDPVAAQLTGGGTLEAAAKKRRPPRLRGGAEVELVADSMESIETLVEALGKSKSRKRDDRNLHASLTEVAKELGTWISESMEKEEKRRLVDEAREKRALAIANAPRRRSGRLMHRVESDWVVDPLEEESLMALSSFKPVPPGAGNITGSGMVGGDLTISKACEKSDPPVSNGLANPAKVIEEGGDGAEALPGPAQALAAQGGKTVGEAEVDAVPLLGNGVCAGNEAPASETSRVTTSSHSAFLSGEVNLRESSDLMEVEILACNGVVPAEAFRGEGDANEVEVRASSRPSPPPSMNGASSEELELEERQSNKRKWSSAPSIPSNVSSNGAPGIMASDVASCPNAGTPSTGSSALSHGVSGGGNSSNSSLAASLDLSSVHVEKKPRLE